MSSIVDEMRAKVAYFFRYQLQCPLVAIEANTLLRSRNDGGQTDVMAVTKARRLIEVEIKTSIADMRKDIHKPKHYWLWRDHFNEQPADDMLEKRPLWKRERWRAASDSGISRPVCHEFYFAVPTELANKARELCDTLYPYAGLLVVYREMGRALYYVSTVKKAKRYKREKASARQLSRMAREMSATLCRLAMDLAGVERL